MVTMLMASFAMSEICTLPASSVECTNPAISAISCDWSPIRSMSEIIFSAEETHLRSFATGC